MEITVTVGPDSLREIDRIAEELRAGGMQVQRVLHELGLITGTMPDGQRGVLTRIDGVQSIDQDKHVEIPPPESEMQ